MADMRTARTTAWAIATAIVVAGCGGGSGSGDGDREGGGGNLDPGGATGVCTSEGWCWANPLPQGNPLSAIWGASDTDVWFAGVAGTVLHWNGSTLALVASGTFSHLRAISGASATDVWAVGDDGAAVHWDGSTWTVQPAAVTEQLTGVWAAGAGEAWAVAAGGDVLHYASGTWTPTASGVSSLAAVWGAAPDDVWIAGAAGALRHWDGIEWSPVDSTETFDLVGLWGLLFHRRLGNRSARRRPALGRAGVGDRRDHDGRPALDIGLRPGERVGALEHRAVPLERRRLDPARVAALRSRRRHLGEREFRLGCRRTRRDHSLERDPVDRRHSAGWHADTVDLVERPRRSVGGGARRLPPALERVHVDEQVRAEHVDAPGSLGGRRERRLDRRLVAVALERDRVDPDRCDDRRLRHLRHRSCRRLGGDCEWPRALERDGVEQRRASGRSVPGDLRGLVVGRLGRRRQHDGHGSGALERYAVDDLRVRCRAVRRMGGGLERRLVRRLERRDPALERHDSHDRR
jgi:hypothetical protein